MRGALIYTSDSAYWQGIIPADAGSTVPGDFHVIGLTDHPRGCGEHATGPRAGTAATGSSPRMRGALLVGQVGGGEVRIIPADAGSTA